MSTAIPVSIKRSPMPLNFQDTPLNTLRAFLRRARGVVDGSQVILGTNNSTRPKSDIGLWMTDRSWRVWDISKGDYIFQPLGLGYNDYEIIARGSPTVNRVATWNSNSSSHTHSGTNLKVAYLADLYIPRETILLDTQASATILLVADAGESWLWKLYQNSDVVISSVPQGKKLNIAVMNMGTSYTLTWNGLIEWEGGTEPTMPVSGAGGTGLAQFIIRNVNGSLIGRMIDSTPGYPVTEVPSGEVPRNYAGTANAPRPNVIKNLP